MFDEDIEWEREILELKNQLKDAKFNNDALEETYVQQQEIIKKLEKEQLKLRYVFEQLHMMLFESKKALGYACFQDLLDVLDGKVSE